MIDLEPANLGELVDALKAFCREWEAQAVCVTYDLPNGNVIHLTVRSDGSAWMTGDHGTVRWRG